MSTQDDNHHYLRLVVDNTNVVPEQPFDDPVITTRDDMSDLRSMFDYWLKNQGSIRHDKPIFVD